jgi:hypothetical protein
MAIVFGVDPGLDGAICVLEDGKIQEHIVCPTVKLGKRRDMDTKAMVDLILEFDDDDSGTRDSTMVIEQVHSMPKQGVTSSFNFGKGYGIWIGIATALRIPIHFVTPQAWKREMLADTDKSKGAAILKAKQLYPDVNLKRSDRATTEHHGLAEALLIATYGERKCLTLKSI